MQTRRIFHRVVKDTIDRARHKYMWIILKLEIRASQNLAKLGEEPIRGGRKGEK